jgi:hypothetical protein
MPSLRPAREHLKRALPAVTAAQYTEAVTWLFASLEAPVAALAEQNGETLAAVSGDFGDELP